MSVQPEQVLNRLATLFGEVQAGHVAVDWVRVNPQDMELVIDHVSMGMIWGASIKGDPKLRPGTVEIHKLGKRPLY